MIIGGRAIGYGRTVVVVGAVSAGPVNARAVSLGSISMSSVRRNRISSGPIAMAGSPIWGRDSNRRVWLVALNDTVGVGTTEAEAVDTTLRVSHGTPAVMIGERNLPGSPRLPFGYFWPWFAFRGDTKMLHEWLKSRIQTIE